MGRLLFLSLLTVLFLVTLVLASDGGEHGCTVCGVDYACDGSTGGTPGDGICTINLCTADCSAPYNCDPDCSYAAEATCNDGIDNDCDGSIDCFDSDCDDDVACENFCTEDGDCEPNSCPEDVCFGPTYYNYPSSCTNTCSGNSCDDCTCSAISSQTCDEGKSCNMVVGCGESSIVCHYDGSSWRWYNATEVWYETAEICNDGYDNDCDGAIDCADSDCLGSTGPGGNACCSSNGDCSDGNTCTTDTCSAAKECTFSNNNNFCGTGECPADSCTNVQTYEDHPSTYDKYCSAGTCSTGSCSLPVTNTCNSGKTCDTSSCGGSTVQCHLDGSSWEWDTTSAVSGTSEICSDNYDNDCDGENGWDGFMSGNADPSTSKGDSECAVGVTGANIVESEYCPGNTVALECTVSQANIRSVTASMASASCSFRTWSGNKAIFDCSINGDASGGLTATCSIDTSKSYAKFGQQSRTDTISQGSSCCSTYSDSTSCSDAGCNWVSAYCNEDNKYYSPADPDGICISGTPTYVCDADKNDDGNLGDAACGATCDSDTVTCPDTICYDTCDLNGVDVWLKNNIANSCLNDCSCSSNSCGSGTKQSCGTTLCSDVFPNTVGSCTNTCDTTATDDVCVACTPTEADCSTCKSGWYNCDGNTANGCESNTACSEICNDNIDNDDDGAIDESDSTCPTTFTISPNPTNISSSVTATFNAGDGAFYGGTEKFNLCDYQGCTGNGECVGNSETCANVDLNGLASYECTFTTPAAEGVFRYYACYGKNDKWADITTSTTEICDNGIDDDGDGFWDYEDDECPIRLRLHPNPAGKGTTVTAFVKTANSDHVLRVNTKKMYLRNVACDTTHTPQNVLCELEPASYDGIQEVSACTFTSPSEEGVYKYYVCIGKQTNSDDDDLVVTNITEDCGNATDDTSDGYIDEADQDCGINMVFSPNPVDAGQNVLVTIGSDDPEFRAGSELLSVREGANCGGAIAGDCQNMGVNGLSSVNCNFTAPFLAGGNSYTACLGENAQTEILNVNVPSTENDCSDGMDNDFDTYVDEGDTDCPFYIDLAPRQVGTGMNVNVTLTAVDGAMNTNGENILIRESTCSGAIVCTIPEAPQPTCTFPAPGAEGQYTYFACVGEQEVNQSISGELANISVNESCPACEGTLKGHVTDEFGNNLDFVLVTAHYSPDEPRTEDSTYTDSSGNYSMNVLKGNHAVSYKKDNYFTEEYTVEINYSEATVQDAVLNEGFCNAQCYNWENRCNKACEGRTFEGGSCSFFDSQVMDKCHDKEFGSWVEYNSSGDTYYYVQCCEGTPFPIEKPYAEISGNIEQLYKRERILVDDKTKQPVKLVVNIWPSD